MVLEILISTMNRENLLFLDDMFINNNSIDYQILIINQTTQDKILTSQNENIRVINSFEYGLSKSRNLAIKNATGDICLIADDDIQYVKGFDNIIKQAFVNNYDASIIKFKIETVCGKKYKTYPKYSKRLIRTKDLFSASSVEIAFKRKNIIDKNSSFNIFFGLGSYFTSGEEYLFLKTNLKKGLIIHFVNEYIVKHNFERSTTNMGSDNYIKTMAAIYYLEYKNLSYLLLVKLIFFVFRRKDIKFNELIAKFKIGIEAISSYKNIVKH